MASKKIVKYTPTFVADFDLIIENMLSKCDARKVNTFISRLIDACDLLKDYPYMGKVTELPPYLLNTEFRQILVGRYLVFYSVIEDVVEVLHVVDGRSDYISTLFEDK